MAEAVFRHKVGKAGLSEAIEADSAGTGDWHIGQRPHRATLEILRQQGIGSEGLTARQVTAEELAEFDYIVALDGKNLRDLKKLAGDRPTGRLTLLLDFLPEAGADDVPDPYYTGNFAEVYDLINRGCDRLLAEIRERENL
jgi:protein-tyrosine phosphatase